MMPTRKIKAALAGGQAAYLVTSNDGRDNSAQVLLTQPRKALILVIPRLVDPSPRSEIAAVEGFYD